MWKRYNLTIKVLQLHINYLSILAGSAPPPLYPLFTTSLVRIQKTIIADIVCPNERRPGPQVVNIIEAFISYDVI